MKLGDIMSRDVRTCTMSSSIGDCAKMMEEFKIGFLPVVDDNGVLVGTLTDRDIVRRAVAAGKGPDAKVEDIYSDEPVHLHSEGTLSDAEDAMMHGRIRRLVIIDDEKKPIGIISLAEIVRNEADPKRLKEVLESILEPMREERTVEALAGTPCYG